MNELASLWWAVFWAAVVFGGLRLGWYALGFVPMPSRRREQLAAIAPAVVAIAAVGYVLLVVGRLFDEGRTARIATGIVLLIGIALAWTTLRDMLAGVFLRAGRVLVTGEHLRLTGDTIVSGRVESLGVRAVVIKTSDGEQAVIPYHRLSADGIVRTPVVDGAYLSTFRIAPSDRVPAGATEQTIRRCALHHHWASPIHEPEVRVLESGELEVTVFALAPERASEIEAAIRFALAVEG